jgi:competence protein ComEC
MQESLSGGNGLLTITFINVGYGESILIEAEKNGIKIIGLIDGGSGEDEEYSGSTGRIRTRDFLAYKNIDILDFVILTHVHEDHVCGLEQFISTGGLVKKLFTVKILPQNVPKLFSSDISTLSMRKFISALNSYRLLLILLQKQKAVTVEIDASSGVISLAEGLFAEIIAPSTERANLLFERLADLYRSFSSSAYDSSFTEKAVALDADLNGFSLALILNYQGKKIFLPGDATPEILSDDMKFKQAFISDMLHCDVLKVAHHGQIDGATEKFITAVSPKILITCSSSDRRYQSAHPDLYRYIGAWLKQNPVYLFTDAIDIKVNELCHAPHSAVFITINADTFPAQLVYDFTPTIFLDRLFLGKHRCTDGKEEKNYRQIAFSNERTI